VGGWQLIGDNGSDIIAIDGGQGYQDEGEARDMADKIIGGHYATAKKLLKRPDSLSGSCGGRSGRTLP